MAWQCLRDGEFISEVPWPAISVEVGSGDPYGNRDTGVVDVLETVEMPEDGPIGIRASPSKAVMGSISQLKCFYTNSLALTGQLEK